MNIAEFLFLLVLLLSVAGAVISALAPAQWTGRILAICGTSAATALLIAAAIILAGHESIRVDLWRLPVLGMLRLRVDSVSAFFMLALGISFLPAYWFSDGYMRRYLAHYDPRSFNIFFHLLLAACALVLAAGDVISFLLAWRIMSGLATFPITLEHRQDENRRASYLFLAMNEAGIIISTVGLLWMVALAGGHTGFSALHGSLRHISPAARWAIFLIVFFGFSVKAGLIPLSSWLPQAHPVAPANMSAIMSGCLLNFGIYGIVRFDAIILPPISAGPGLVVLVVGALSALIGILYATIDNDMKKMLAHSSIENLGIIAANVGMGMVFTAYDLPVLAAIAYVVAMYHMINHSAYKTLLFIGAGAIDQQTGTRDMNQLGGLLKRMPMLAALFLVGALAIAALPPLNGFVSEWLTLQTILRSEEFTSHFSRVVFALCGAGLALTAALAVTCFVKAFAMSFLGPAHSEKAARALEPVKSARMSMAILAFACIFLGIGPTWVIPAIDHAMKPLTNNLAASALVPPFFSHPHGNKQFAPGFMHGFDQIGAGVGNTIIPARGLVVLHQGGKSNPVVYAMSTFYMAIVLALIIFITWLLVRWGTRRRTVTISEPWAGGLRRLAPDMTYSATGFSNPVRVIFRSIFGPAIREDSSTAVAGHFRTAITKRRDDGYIVDRLFLRPLTAAVNYAAKLLAKIHKPGVVNAYAAWVFLILLAILILNRLI
ncbi:MAG: proton-conducting transporter transmembrane domain-containing protein [Phycisphaerae bacterium]